IGAEQLRMHRHSRCSTPALTAFREDTVQGRRVQRAIGHPDELTDATIDTTDAGENIAHGRVHQPLHRGQDDAVHQGVIPWSSSTGIPSCSARASLLPAPGPATTQWVLLDTLPATLAPRPSRYSLATSREKASRVPVSTQV